MMISAGFQFLSKFKFWFTFVLLAVVSQFFMVSGAAVASEKISHAGTLYRVAALRAATGVAATANSNPGEQTMGVKVSFGKRLVWYDGRECGKWSLEQSSGPAPLDINDRILSDLQFGPWQAGTPLLTASDFRRNLNYKIICDGKPFASMVKIDANVMVSPTPNGTTHVVLEKILKPGIWSGVQASLAALGLYQGRMEGHPDTPTRDAIAIFAQTRGSTIALRPGILTENVRNAIMAAGNLAIDPANDLINKAIVTSRKVKGILHAEALATLAMAVGRSGDPHRARDIADMAMKTKFPSADKLSPLLSSARGAAALAWAGEWATSDEILKHLARTSAKLPNAMFRSIVRIAVVRARIDALDPIPALAILDQVMGKSPRTPMMWERGVHGLAETFARVGEGTTAAGLAGMIATPSTRALADGAIAAHLGRIALGKRLKVNIDDPNSPPGRSIAGMRKALVKITDAKTRKLTELKLASIFAEEEMHGEAYGLFASVLDANYGQERDANILYEAARAAGSLAHSFMDGWSPEKGEKWITRTETILKKIANPEHRAKILGILGGAWQEALEYRKSEKTFTAAIEAADTVADDYQKAKAYAFILERMF